MAQKKAVELPSQDLSRSVEVRKWCWTLSNDLVECHHVVSLHLVVENSRRSLLVEANGYEAKNLVVRLHVVQQNVELRKQNQSKTC